MISHCVQPGIGCGVLTGGENVIDQVLLRAPAVGVLWGGRQSVFVWSGLMVLWLVGAKYIDVEVGGFGIAAPRCAGGGWGIIVGFAITLIPELSSAMIIGLSGSGFVVRLLRCIFEIPRSEWLA